jgi:hypothetical protein
VLGGVHWHDNNKGETMGRETVGLLYIVGA